MSLSQLWRTNVSDRNKTEGLFGSPVVKISPSNTESAGLIPGQGAKIPHASRPKHQNIKQKQYYNKFNKGILNSPH